MNIQLTNEQFQDVKVKLVNEIKKDFKNTLTEILEDEFDIYEEVSEHIHKLLQDEMLANNMDKIVEKIDKEQLVKLVAELLMDKLDNRW